MQPSVPALALWLRHRHTHQADADFKGYFDVQAALDSSQAALRESVTKQAAKAAQNALQNRIGALHTELKQSRQQHAAAQVT